MNEISVYEPLKKHDSSRETVRKPEKLTSKTKKKQKKSQIW